MNVFDVLKERGFIAQTTGEDEIRKMLETEKISFYIGFDPTADSLHIGHFLQLIVMSHMQRAGHKPIAILGGATAMIGDPSGKSDMRKMLTREQIRNNAECFKKQMSRFIDFSDDKALIVDNYDWLGSLNYIEFLREIGVHFSVNRMLTAECFKSRLEKGLTFIEFNYMLMQSYDYLLLNRKYGCKLQLGGDDQWSNIINGADLIRRVDGKEAYGMTFHLLLTSDGRKMGKTEKGAVWLDENKTSPYDFYQYWRNIEDDSVIKCMKLLTFLPMEQIREYEGLRDKEINNAKQVLAYELTKIVHGEEKAKASHEASKALFDIGVSSDNMPKLMIGEEKLDEGFDVLDALVLCGFAVSRGDARRLVTEGGVTLNGDKVTDFKMMITKESFIDKEIIIKRGKKKYFKLFME